ncbi:NUDIX hydrolase [Patescibacteria group bacterium]
MNYKYCPYCKENLIFHKEYYKCKKCKKIIYLNSSPTGSIVPIKGNDFMLSRRAIEPKKGYYDVIGGFLNYGEHPEKGALREFREETDIKIKMIKQIGIYIDKSYEFQGEKTVSLNIVYLAKIIGGEEIPKDDIDELIWFPIEKPPKNLAFPWMENLMKDLRKFKR